MNGIIIVGSNAPETSVGLQLLKSAENLGLQSTLINLNEAYTQGISRKLAFRYLGDFPLRGRNFQTSIENAIRSETPKYLVSTGKAPVFGSTIQFAKRLGVKTINFSTDDPWNPAHKARWFFQALKEYDVLASPRQENLVDYRMLNLNPIYIPFAHTSELHFWEDQPETANLGDVFFAGGCDDEREPYFTALIQAGIRPALYGGYWERHKHFRPFFRGRASLADMRQLHAQIPISVCLVRRANRDGHVMRTYEAPAMGACLAMEDTAEHRSIFGKDGDTVRYFTDPSSLVDVCQKLLAAPEERRQLRERCHGLITQGRNSYTDRLTDMLSG